MCKPLLKLEGTDWERVKRETAQDAPITHTAANGPCDPSDAAAVAANWQQASIKRGRGRPTAAVNRPIHNKRVDADEPEAFKATGQRWQTRINAALRVAVAHELNKA